MITGGARGVTAEVAVKLAETYQCKLLLLGRSPEPEDEPNWLAELTDEAAIKKAVMEHAEEKLTPAELQKQYQSILANREVRATLQRINKSARLTKIVVHTTCEIGVSSRRHRVPKRIGFQPLKPTRCSLQSAVWQGVKSHDFPSIT